MSPVRLYQVVSKTNIQWLPLEEAAALFDGGYGDVELTFKVKEVDGLVRPLCQVEMDSFRALAPTHGAR